MEQAVSEPSADAAVDVVQQALSQLQPDSIFHGFTRDMFVQWLRATDNVDALYCMGTFTGDRLDLFLLGLIKAVNSASKITEAVAHRVMCFRPQGVFASRNMHRVQPWKNGLGSSTVVAEHPRLAAFDELIWQVSVTEITQDCPFSALPGLSRLFCVLEGGGVELSVLETEEEHAATVVTKVPH